MPPDRQARHEALRAEAAKVVPTGSRCFAAGEYRTKPSDTDARPPHTLAYRVPCRYVRRDGHASTQDGHSLATCLLLKRNGRIHARVAAGAEPRSFLVANERKRCGINATTDD